MTEDAYQKGLSLAAAMLGRRALTAQQLAEKLFDKGIEEETIHKIIKRMKELDAIDDTAYAKSRAKSLRERGYGKYRVYQDLLHRGIEDTIAKKVADDVQPNIEKMVRFITQKMKGTQPDRKLRQKTKAALYRKGHSKEAIDMAMQEYKKRMGDEID